MVMFCAKIVPIYAVHVISRSAVYVMMTASFVPHAASLSAVIVIEIANHVRRLSALLIVIGVSPAEMISA